MRIISGKYKSRRFDVPHSFKARPTTDFAKENLFNILNNLIDFEGIAALDLFSGTGSIAFELLSRGCREVVCVENYAAHYAFIQQVRKTLNDDALKAVRADAFNYMATCKRQFDLIFADPPYALPALPQIPEKVFAHRLLTDNGLLVVEHPKNYDFSSTPRFLQHRSYGAVNFSLFGKSEL
ncbi:MAG: RsmD family RNA methyltransferase [Candidatus Symbiothrix sp.]|jgi:16S rRNA (guanine(966)-N(2))-methyltransferase RsmD|nr:RsmD family RNA methyltransferase [Candidatus Symbiothrix sp.]